jgi:glycosyltransferase involved in cell wall biosynthesis
MQPMMKDLSIAIPTFGDSPYLGQTLESIINQIVPVDCIVCDGGSNFNFSNFERNYIKHKRITPDPGMVTCWSEAANDSHSDYITFLADDNALEPQFAEKMLSFMREFPTCEAVFCNQFLISEEGEIDLQASYKMTRGYGRHKLKFGLINPNLTSYLIENNSIPIEGCVIKRSVWEKFGPFSQHAKGAFDLHFLTKLLLEGVQFGFIPDYLVQFRNNSNSYSVRHRVEHVKGAIWALENLACKSSSLQKPLQSKTFEYYEKLLRLELSSQEYMQVEKYLSVSFFGWLIILRAKLYRALRKIIKRN